MGKQSIEKIIRKCFNQAIVGLLGVSFFMATAGAATQVEHHDFMVDSGDHTACLECHDSLNELTNTDNKKGCDNGVTTTHPTGTNYPPMGKEKLFNSREFLQTNGIILFDGMITCLSCHNLKHSSAKHLAVNNVGSKLCLTCHHT